MDTIVNKIKKSVQSGTGLTCLYGSLDSINVQMGDQTEFPVAFFVLLNNGSLDDRSSNYRERVDVAMFFVKPTEFDFESIENEAIISECKQCAFQWLNSLFLGGDLRYITTLNTSRVYNQMDDILTGYALRVRLEELVGECINIPKPDPPRPNYLRFTALQDNSTIKLHRYYYSGTPPEISLEYSTDGDTWNEFLVESTTITLNNGDYVLMRGHNDTFALQEGGFKENWRHEFKMTGKIAASGDITSILNGTGGDCELPIDCFNNMFVECQSLITAPELPATTLASSCYQNMFYGCTSLTSAPELPATTLASLCYYQMFAYCTSLTTAPELPATTLANHCYGYMFYRCTSLTSAPELPATTLMESCYASMFENCTSLTTAPELPAEQAVRYCYSRMFYGCTSLTSAPTRLCKNVGIYSIGCFTNMFNGCSSLTTAPELPALQAAQDSYSNMFANCTSLKATPHIALSESFSQCCTSMFYGCTSLETATMNLYYNNGNHCYSSMFYGCSSLRSITTRFNSWRDSSTNWVYGVAATGTFRCLRALPAEYGVDKIPTGWTVEYID